MPHMRTGTAWCVVEAGVGRRDSNAIGVAYRELKVRKNCLVFLLAEAAGRGVVVPPRETQFPGRSAGPQMSSCPTWRPPVSFNNPGARSQQGQGLKCFGSPLGRAGPRPQSGASFSAFSTVSVSSPVASSLAGAVGPHAAAVSGAALFHEECRQDPEFRNRVSGPGTNATRQSCASWNRDCPRVQGLWCCSWCFLRTPCAVL